MMAVLGLGECKDSKQDLWLRRLRLCNDFTPKEARNGSSHETSSSIFEDPRELDTKTELAPEEDCPLIGVPVAGPCCRTGCSQPRRLSGVAFAVLVSAVSLAMAWASGA